MSLFSWFKDYIYIPLGGNKVTLWVGIRNTFIIFAISGLWHGANWTFIVYGLLNALFIIPSVLLKKTRFKTEIVAEGKLFPTFREFITMLLTFSIAVLAGILFRSSSLTQAFAFYSGIFSSSFFTSPEAVPYVLVFTIIVFMTIEWLGREQQFAIAKIGLKWPELLRYSFYYILMMAIFYFAVNNENQEFIYFHF